MSDVPGGYLVFAAVCVAVGYAWGFATGGDVEARAASVRCVETCECPHQEVAP